MPQTPPLFAGKMVNSSLLPAFAASIEGVSVCFYLALSCAEVPLNFGLMSDYQVQHQADQSQFIIELEGGESAYIQYRRSGAEPNKENVDFYKTFVPHAFRSEGLAALLVDKAFDWAEQQNLIINNSCSYSAKKYQRRQRSV